MEKGKNLKSLEIAEAGDIYLQFSGLLNWEKYSRLTTEEVKEWVDEDTKRRANEWVTKHFKEDPFNGMLYLSTTYICLNFRLDRKDTVIVHYEISYADNKLTSFEQEDFQIIPEGKN